MTTNDTGIRTQAKQTQAPDRRSYQFEDSESALTPRVNDEVKSSSLQEHYRDIEVTLGFSDATATIRIQDMIHGIGDPTITPNSYTGASSRANSTHAQSISTTNTSTTGQ
jgi:hypothetical protein